MQQILSSLAIMSLFGAVACDQIRMPGQDADAPAAAVPAEQTAPPAQVIEPEAPKPLRLQADIDWSAARSDFAARDTGDENTVSIAGGSNPPVPVLLPDMPVSIASGDSGLQFRPTADGYFAVQPGETYDLIITGTDKLIADAEGAAAPDTELRFEETITGAQISFSRYGASYLAQFMCKDPATATIGSCVSEQDARTTVEELLIAGTR